MVSRLRRSGGLQRHRPSVIAEHPAGIGAAVKPGVGMRYALDLGRTFLAQGLVEEESLLDIWWSGVPDAAAEDGRILHRGCGALRHPRRHRMAGIAEQRDAALRPDRHRLAR